MKELNVKLVQGDLNDPASYREYLKDAYGVFIVSAGHRGYLWNF